MRGQKRVQATNSQVRRNSSPVPGFAAPHWWAAGAIRARGVAKGQKRVQATNSQVRRSSSPVPGFAAPHWWAAGAIRARGVAKGQKRVQATNSQVRRNSSPVPGFAAPHWWAAGAGRWGERGAYGAKAGTGNEFASAAKFVPCPRFCGSSLVGGGGDRAVASKGRGYRQRTRVRGRVQGAKAGTGNEFASAAKFVPCPRFCGSSLVDGGGGAAFGTT